MNPQPEDARVNPQLYVIDITHEQFGRCQWNAVYDVRAEGGYLHFNTDRWTVASIPIAKLLELRIRRHS